MTHHMHLNTSPFEKIQTGHKDIELRVNDEKRRKLHVGDEIEFEERGSSRRFVAAIVALRVAPTFGDLLTQLDLTRCGWSSPLPSFDEAVADIHRFYPPEEETRWGVVGIELAVESYSV